MKPFQCPECGGGAFANWGHRVLWTDFAGGDPTAPLFFCSCCGHPVVLFQGSFKDAADIVGKDAMQFTINVVCHDPKVEQSLRDLQTGQNELLRRVNHLQATVDHQCRKPRLEFIIGPITDQVKGD